MGDIRIRVGVALDANVKTVFRPIVLAAQEAGLQVRRALNAGARGAMQDTLKAHTQGATNVVVVHQKAAKAVNDTQKKITSEADREAKAREKISEREERAKDRAMNRLANEAKRWERERVRDAERAANERVRIAAKEASDAARERERNARRVGYWSMRNFSPVTPTLQMGQRMMGELARGAGIDFSAGHMVQDFVSRQQLATQLSNQAYIQGDAAPNEAAKHRVSASTLMGEANTAAMNTASSATDILQGMSSFVGKTGDLQTAREAMGDLAKLSKATGTNMGDMLDAAADVSNALGDIPNKAKVINDTMRAIAGQGQIGSVEISNMAKDMAKLAAMSGSFKLGDGTAKTLKDAGLTNETSQNVAIMGALAQAAKAHGGAPSATVAGNSSMAFIRDMSNRTTMKRWREQGMNVFADKQHTQIRDPKALILEVLNKTHGDLGQIANLMPNQNSRRVLNAFAKTYGDSVKASRDSDPKMSEKDRNLKALKAVSDEFDKYLKVTMGGEEIQDKFNEAMNTSASKAQLFNNKMQQVADKTAEKLLPALEKLAPTIEKAAEALGNFLVWMSSHPGEAIATALSASIAKASIENTIRAGVENIFKGSAGNTAMGAIGGIFAGAAIAMTIHQVGKLYIDNVLNEESKQKQGDVEHVLAASAGNVARSGDTISKDEAKNLEDRLAQLKADKARLEKGPSTVDKIGRGATFAAALGGGAIGMMFGSGKFFEEHSDLVRRQTEMQETQMRETTEAIQRLEVVMRQIKDGRIQVEDVSKKTSDSPGNTVPVPAKVGP